MWICYGWLTKRLIIFVKVRENCSNLLPPKQFQQHTGLIHSSNYSSERLVRMIQIILNLIWNHYQTLDVISKLRKQNNEIHLNCHIQVNCQRIRMPSLETA